MAQKAYKRRTYIVNRRFQFKYIFIILSVMLITVFSVSFTTFYIVWKNVIDSFFFVPEAARKLSGIYMNTARLLILPGLFLAVCAVVAGLIFSHRIAGPVYRVKKTAEDIAGGDLSVTVRFRKDDDLHDLADALNGMIGKVREIVKEDNELIEEINRVTLELEAGVPDSGTKKHLEELTGIVKRLQKSSGRFKL
jgi:methyl-accepting chemotaxis protein